MKTGTWETLVASAKNFFISSSVNTTFIADPLCKWQRKEISFHCDFKGDDQCVRHHSMGLPTTYVWQTSQASSQLKSLVPLLTERKAGLIPNEPSVSDSVPFEKDGTLVVPTTDAQLPLCLDGQTHRSYGEKSRKDLSYKISHFSLR